VIRTFRRSNARSISVSFSIILVRHRFDAKAVPLFLVDHVGEVVVRLVFRILKKERENEQLHSS
jgi:hypothetical protein